MGSLALVYYDDVLLAGSTSAVVEHSTNALVSHLRQKGLLLNRKCCLSPVAEIEWLGKIISQREVRNTLGRSRQLAVAFRRLTLPFPRGLRRVLG